MGFCSPRLNERGFLPLLLINHPKKPKNVVRKTKNGTRLQAIFHIHTFVRDNHLYDHVSGFIKLPGAGAETVFPLAHLHSHPDRINQLAGWLSQNCRRIVGGGFGPLWLVTLDKKSATERGDLKSLNTLDQMITELASESECSISEIQPIYPVGPKM